MEEGTEVLHSTDPARGENKFESVLMQQLPYDHDKYWPALMNVCRERRSEQDELWRKGERKVGRSEREWKVSQQARDSTGEAQTVEL